MGSRPAQSPLKKMRLFLVIGMILLVLVTACSARPNNDEESMSLVEEMVHSKLRLSKRDDNDYEDEQDDEYDEDDYEEGDEDDQEDEEEDEEYEENEDDYEEDDVEDDEEVD